MVNVLRFDYADVHQSLGEQYHCDNVIFKLSNTSVKAINTPVPYKLNQEKQANQWRCRILIRTSAAATRSHPVSHWLQPSDSKHPVNTGRQPASRPANREQKLPLERYYITKLQ